MGEGNWRFFCPSLSSKLVAKIETAHGQLQGSFSVQLRPTCMKEAVDLGFGSVLADKLALFVLNLYIADLLI